MNIGIMVHSQTGNTKKAAAALEKKLIAAGHTVHMSEIIATGKARPGDQNITLKNIPDLTPYEGIIFASPVMAFSLAPAMKVFISGISSLKDKKTAFLCTKALPFAWTGGNQAIGWMKDQCRTKEADVKGSGIVFWKSKKREYYLDKAMTDIIDSL